MNCLKHSKLELALDRVLSPILFNLTLEKVVRSLLLRQYMEILEQNAMLAYADDIVIIGSFQS